MSWNYFLERKKPIKHFPCYVSFIGWFKSFFFNFISFFLPSSFFFFPNSMQESHIPSFSFFFFKFSFLLNWFNLVNIGILHLLNYSLFKSPLFPILKFSLLWWVAHWRTKIERAYPLRHYSTDPLYRKSLSIWVFRLHFFKKNNVFNKNR